MNDRCVEPSRCNDSSIEDRVGAKPLTPSPELLDARERNDQ